MKEFLVEMRVAPAHSERDEKGRFKKSTEHSWFKLYVSQDKARIIFAQAFQLVTQFGKPTKG